MEIAVGEISANIIEHAAKERPLRLRMEVRVLPDKVQVSSVDDVRRRTWWTASPPVMPDQMAESGRPRPWHTPCWTACTTVAAPSITGR